MKEPKYLPLVLVAIAARPGRAGSVNHITVLHDEWCGVFAVPQRACDCEPEIQKDGSES